MSPSERLRVARRLAITLAATAGAITLACADHHDTPTAPDTGDGAIQGTITSEKTGTGIANIVVALIRDGHVRRATPTDSTGAFAFHDIARGQYIVRLTGLELSDLSLRHTAFTPLEDTVSVADRTPVRLFFAAVGLIPPRIVGTVSCGGQPVIGGAVRVIGGAVDTTVSTNAQGKFGATELDPGHYAVIVTSAPCSVTPPFDAVQVLPGQMAQVDFTG